MFDITGFKYLRSFIVSLLIFVFVCLSVCLVSSSYSYLVSTSNFVCVFKDGMH